MLQDTMSLGKDAAARRAATIAKYKTAGVTPTGPHVKQNPTLEDEFDRSELLIAVVGMGCFSFCSFKWLLVTRRRMFSSFLIGASIFTCMV